MNWANQIRVLKENFGQLLTTIGNGFISLLTPVVQVVNKIISYLNVLAKAMASIFGKLFGKSKSGTGGGSVLGGVANDVSNIGGASGGINDTSNAVGGLSDNLGSASKKAKELGKNLMGIDEINNISPESDNGGSGSGGSGGGAGIDTSGIGGLDFGEPEIDTSSVDEAVDKMINKINEVIEPFKSVWNQMKQIITPNINYMKEQFKGFIQAIIDWCKGFWNNGGKELVASIALLTASFLGFGFALTGTVFQVLKDLLNHLNPVTNAFTRDFVDALTRVIQGITEFVTSATGIGKILLDSGLQDIINMIGDIAMMIGTILLNALDSVINSVNSFANSWFGTTVIPVLLQAIIVPVKILLGVIKALFLGLQEIQPVLNAVLSIILSYVAINKVADVIDMLDDGLYNVSTRLGALAGKLKNNANLLSNTLSNAFKNASSNLKYFFSNLGNVGRGIKNLIINMKALTKELIKQGVQLAKNIALWIKEKVSVIASTVAQKAATVATKAWTLIQTIFNAVMNANPIVLVITLIAGLITAIIAIGAKMGWWTKLWDALGKAFDWVKEKLSFLKPIISAIGDALGWIGDKISGLWSGIKSFFGFEDDAEEASEAVDDASDSVDGLGESFDETEQPITDATQRISTFADTAKEQLNSIDFDGSGLVNQFDEACNTVSERIGMLSGKAQEFLEALSSGDQEKLAEMSDNSQAYIEEMTAMYSEFDEAQKLAFLEKYGIVSGVNDDILNYEGLTYEQRLARANAYNLSILKNENVTYQEKQRIRQQAEAEAKASYDRDLTSLQQSVEQKKARLQELERSYATNTDAGAKEAKELKDAIAKEEKEIQRLNGETKDVKIKNAKDAKDGVKQASSDSSKAETDSYKELEKSSKNSLKAIQKELETTKSKINDFKTNTNNKLKDCFKDVSKKCTEELNKIKTAIDNFDATLKVKIPHFSMSGEFDAEKGKVPTVGVKYYARGGIVNKATNAIIGEAGKEAVVPLERNTEWMDIIAGRLTSGVFEAVSTAMMANTNNNTQVVNGDVYLDGDKVGVAIYDKIEKEKKRRGTNVSK